MGRGERQRPYPFGKAPDRDKSLANSLPHPSTARLQHGRVWDQAAHTCSPVPVQSWPSTALDPAAAGSAAHVFGHGCAFGARCCGPSPMPQADTTVIRQGRAAELPRLCRGATSYCKY